MWQFFLWWKHLVDMAFARPLRGKDPASVATALKSCLEKARSQNIKVTTIQTDQGGEFNKVFDATLNKYKIKHVFSPPHQPISKCNC